MSSKTYNTINTICLLGAIAAVFVFDQFEGSRLIAGLLGGSAAIVSSWAYFINRVQDPETSNLPIEAAATESTADRSAIVEHLRNYLAESSISKMTGERRIFESTLVAPSLEFEIVLHDPHNLTVVNQELTAVLSVLNDELRDSVRNYYNIRNWLQRGIGLTDSRLIGSFGGKRKPIGIIHDDPLPFPSNLEKPLPN